MFEKQTNIEHKLGFKLSYIFYKLVKNVKKLPEYFRPQDPIPEKMIK